jgi:hypothetical protein
VWNCGLDLSGWGCGRIWEFWVFIIILLEMLCLSNREFVSRIIEMWEASNNVSHANQQENNWQSAYLHGPLIVACSVAPAAHVKTDLCHCNFRLHGSINCQSGNQTWNDGGRIWWFEQCNEGNGEQSVLYGKWHPQLSIFRIWALRFQYKIN